MVYDAGIWWRIYIDIMGKYNIDFIPYKVRWVLCYFS